MQTVKYTKLSVPQLIWFFLMRYPLPSGSRDHCLDWVYSESLRHPVLDINDGKVLVRYVDNNNFELVLPSQERFAFPIFMPPMSIGNGEFLGITDFPKHPTIWHSTPDNRSIVRLERHETWISTLSVMNDRSRPGPWIALFPPSGDRVIIYGAADADTEVNYSISPDPKKWRDEPVISEPSHGEFTLEELMKFFGQRHRATVVDYLARLEERGSFITIFDTEEGEGQVDLTFTGVYGAKDHELLDLTGTALFEVLCWNVTLTISKSPDSRYYLVEELNAAHERFLRRYSQLN